MLAKVKAGSALTREAVQQKKDAAKRWARRVSAEVGGEWAYLLVTETDIEASKGSWPAVRAAGR